MIYLDHAATTPICEAAKKAIIDHIDDFGNPSSSHEIGHKALMLIEDARERIAKCINAEPDEIYFTSGGTEANNWAINFVADHHIFVSAIEHHSILNHPVVKRHGKIIPCYRNGEIDYELLYDKFAKIPISSKKFVSCMRVNNEIGTVQDTEDIADMVHKYNGIFHTDAVQGMYNMPDFIKDGDIIDMMSASAHKFGGLKGSGFLYVKKGIEIAPLIYGGKQENNKRAGTENVLGIIAMAASLEDYYNRVEKRNKHVRTLRDKLIFELLKISGVQLNGINDNPDPDEDNYYREYGNINIRIDGVKGDDVVAMADQYGICISTGSACNEGIAAPSHVLKAIGLSDEEALSSIRITLGHENTFEEIERVCDILPKIITRLRTI